MSAVAPFRSDPTRYARRLYCVDVQQDMFGRRLLVRDRGRARRLRQRRVLSFATFDETPSAIRLRCLAKERRGYTSGAYPCAGCGRIDPRVT